VRRRQRSLRRRGDVSGQRRVEKERAMRPTGGEGEDDVSK
jgi:hypothetical protein